MLPCACWFLFMVSGALPRKVQWFSRLWVEIPVLESKLFKAFKTQTLHFFFQHQEVHQQTNSSLSAGLVGAIGSNRRPGFSETDCTQGLSFFGSNLLNSPLGTSQCHSNSSQGGSNIIITQIIFIYFICQYLDWNKLILDTFPPAGQNKIDFINFGNHYMVSLILFNFPWRNNIFFCMCVFFKLFGSRYTKCDFTQPRNVRCYSSIFYNWLVSSFWIQSERSATRWWFRYCFCVFCFFVNFITHFPKPSCFSFQSEKWSDKSFENIYWKKDCMREILQRSFVV